MHALKTIWSADRINALNSRLSEYQQELTVRLLAYLNAKMDLTSWDQSSRFNSLDESGARITEALILNQCGLDQIKDDLAHKHNEVMAAFLTFSNVQTKVVHHSGAIGDNIEGLEAPLEPQHSSGGTLSNPGTLKADTVDTFQFSTVIKTILETLRFSQITDRFDGVKDAHRKTFRWIFDPPVTNDDTTPWSNLPEWLQSSSGCYWVNGKAGSGKSTLMKYIWNEAALTSCLESWAPPANEGALVKASFFFWNVGSHLQKSQQGLLRSLLHDVLRAHPQLIPSVMPELSRQVAKSAEGLELNQPTMPQLLRWFGNLCKQSGPSLRMFFLIDGLDEYDGDYLELIDLNKNAADTCPDVKFLLSSRPITPCLDAFRSGPRLRLHDLTSTDIRAYCCDYLEKRLAARGESEVTEIINALIERSAGVFLWVVLVVKSVIRGLQDGDRLDELHSRLDEIPTELLELYQHLLNKVPQQYRAQSCEIFQIYMTSLPIENEIRQHRLLAIQLAFTQQSGTGGSKSLVFDPRLEWQRSSIAMVYEQLDQRLQSRCCGILELRSQPMRHPGLKNQPCIEFIHRSAAEFLQNSSVWGTVESWNPGSNHLKQLFSSCISLATAVPQPFVPGWAIIYDTIRSGLRYARMGASEEAAIPTEDFVRFDRIITSHWEALLQDVLPHYTTTEHWSILALLRPSRRLKEPTVWDSELPQPGIRSILNSPNDIGDSSHLGFLRVAVLYGLGGYLLSNAPTLRHCNGASIVDTDTGVILLRRFYEEEKSKSIKGICDKKVLCTYYLE